MKIRFIALCVFVFATPSRHVAETPKPWWPDAVEKQLALAKGNRVELEKALNGIPNDQRKGMEFLVANMPVSDLTTLDSGFLKSNHELAYKARSEVKWGMEIPEEVFFNNILPYANVDEKRDPWRKELYELCMPIIKGCNTPTEVTQKLNSELFKKLTLKYAPQRGLPNLSPKQSISQGQASCTGLSIVLSDACRAVGVPTRLVGTPNWSDKRGNHTWIEIWDKGWHFTGACEPDPEGLDRGWFVADAAKAQKGSLEHAIFAVSFRKTNAHFPMVWALDNKTVPGEDITDRYTKKIVAKTETVRVSFRVIDENKKRVVRNVTAYLKSDEKNKHEGISRGETADLNDFLSFDLQPQQVYVLQVGSVQKVIETGKVGATQIVELTAGAMSSADALASLKGYLAARPKSFAELANADFAKTALDKADAAAARKLLWEAHVSTIRTERKKEIEDRILKEGTLEMPFDFTMYGDKPKSGRSLWISLHGGGGTTKQVNDRQWQNQKKLYAPDEGIYLAPRAPTNTWNLWHESHIDRLFARLIEDLIVLEEVNPDRVYILGYSAGGDGVYQLAPRMADHWAAAAMMAGHPNGVSLLSLRNVPFALQVGGNDSAYDRNKVGKEYGEQLVKLQKDDEKGYEHFVKIREGKGHWMDLEDKAALPWMAKFSRNAIPERIVWKQTGTARDRSYWLAVPTKEAKLGSLVVAERNGQTIAIAKAEQVQNLILHFDDRMCDLDKPITITHAGKELYTGIPSRCIHVMLSTLVGRGDPKLMFDAAVRVELPITKN